MPRPQKSGLDYFPLDVKFFSDPKLKILKARYGTDGITMYIYLLCEIYNSGYFIRIDDDYLYIISDELNLKPDLVKQVLTFLLERSLFNNTLFQSDAVLTSAGIQKRYQLAVKERAKKNPIQVNGFWLLNDEETETFIKVNPILNSSEKNGSYSGKNDGNSRELSLKESKVKESKEKNINTPSPVGTGARARQPFEEIVSMYHSICISLPQVIELTDRRKSQMKARLKKYCLDDFKRLFQTAEASDFLTGRKDGSDWKADFNWLINENNMVKVLEGSYKNNTSGKSGSKKNAFHNFEQRETSYDSMVMKQMQSWLKPGEEGKLDGGD